MKIGTITQVSGPVVDVEFEAGHLPKIKEALSVELNGQTRVMEVAQHMSERVVRCIMLAGSEGLARGMKVTAPGKTIEVPVGEQTLGRMFNVLGQPIDGGPAVADDVPRSVRDAAVRATLAAQQFARKEAQHHAQITPAASGTGYNVQCSIRDMETDFQDTLARCRTVEATLQSVWQGKKLLRLMGLLLKVIAPLM